MLKVTSAVLALGVELAMLVAYGLWGLHLPYSLFVRLAAALVPVLGVAFLWGRFLSPMAPRRLTTLPRVLGKIAVFVGGTAAAWAAGLALFAGLIALAAAASLVLEFVIGVPPVVEPPAA